MKFRKSVKSDIKDIMDIISEAQEYFKMNGIDQWQNNYPNKEVISNDIDNGESYVFLKDDKIAATTVISFRGEKTYDSITDGQWITNGKFAVIHRIAVHNDYKGLGISKEIIKTAEELSIENDIHSIKADTHKENIPMQNLLKKSGFKYCGIIYLEDGAERVAFEKVI